MLDSNWDKEKNFSLLYEGKLILRFNYQFREYNQSYDTSFLDDIILDYELIFHNDSIIWYRYRWILTM